VRGGQYQVKDDRTLTDQSFCPLILNLDAVMVALDRAEKETGKKAYPVNVTAGADIILGRRRRQWKPGRGRFSSGNMQKTTKSLIQI